MFCENCGNKISRFTSYCPYCNYQVNIKNNDSIYNENNSNNIESIYNNNYENNKKEQEYKNTFYKENNEKANQNIEQNKNSQTNNINILQKDNPYDKPSFWLNTVLPLISPILAIFVSIIIWKSSPKRAKSLLKWTIILGILSIVFNIIKDLYIEPMLLEWYLSQLPTNSENPGQYINFLK